MGTGKKKGKTNISSHESTSDETSTMTSEITRKKPIEQDIEVLSDDPSNGSKQ